MTLNVISPNSREEKRLLIRCMILTGIFIIFDQVSKAVIEKYVTSPIEVIPGFFNIVHWGNSGAAWGIFAGQRWPLLAVSIGFFLFVVFYFRSLADGWPERYYALALVVSGIFGNSIDRIWRHGTVVDFLDFYVSKYHWPAFNVADSAICIGVGLYILSSFIRPDKDKTAEEK